MGKGKSGKRVIVVLDVESPLRSPRFFMTALDIAYR